jgi:hypothetical protein
MTGANDQYIDFIHHEDTGPSLPELLVISDYGQVHTVKFT